MISLNNKKIIFGQKTYFIKSCGFLNNAEICTEQIGQTSGEEGGGGENITRQEWGKKKKLY